ncbi:WAT1-related protein At5g47470 isoform X2 [Andrographis paniculata]|uniref:WAT1-related protein At5g47470 isoform X2 n=1 Tax=Andrographis paniculata TaxID=175694 RepID=UPI0021E77776|nr:WAT1-related protein At5g47470 isoform X2 [Andrographis paniculata]
MKMKMMKLLSAEKWCDGEVEEEESNYKREVIEEVVVIVGLVGVQFVYAGNSILLSYFMKLGFHPSSLIIFSTFATSLVLSPLSFLERKQWPDRISCRFFIQVLLLSFGIHLTSPTIATAMPNLAPGLIFFIAWACRLETIRLHCIYTRAKLAGTFLCMSGAFLMSLMQSAHAAEAASPADYQLLDAGTLLGCLYLIAAVFVLSSQVVLQAITLGEFPAPITLCAVTAVVGMAITAAVHMAEEQRWELGWPAMTIPDMITYAIVAGSAGGTSVVINAWATRKRGPLVVSIFNPLSTLISAVVSGDFIGVGSLTGMCLMFTGLYYALWAKGKEDLAVNHHDCDHIDTMPLLA